MATINDLKKRMIQTRMAQIQPEMPVISPPAPRRSLGEGLARFGAILAGQQPPSAETNPYIKAIAEAQAKNLYQDPAERLIKANQAVTGSPEFELKKAQVMANVRAEEALRVDEEKRRAEALRYQTAQQSEQNRQPNGPVKRKYDEKIGAFVDVPESASERIFRLKELDSLASNAENVRQQSGIVERAAESLPNVDTGVVANARRSWNKFWGKDNPELADWQGLKTVLTGVQLDYSDRTKGAISDREMATFAKAVANDDFATVMQMKNVLNAYYNKIHGNLDTGIATYEDMFQIDPREYSSMKNLPRKRDDLFGNSPNGQPSIGNQPVKKQIGRFTVEG